MVAGGKDWPEVEGMRAGLKGCSQAGLATQPTLCTGLTMDQGNLARPWALGSWCRTNPTTEGPELHVDWRSPWPAGSAECAVVRLVLIVWAMRWVIPGLAM